MRNECRALDVGNRTYQRQFAENLVRSLGMDNAIDARSQNSWMGALEVILKDGPSVACQETIG